MVVQIDSEELQRARAHLKETLESKIEKLKKIEAEKMQQNQNETKAVVHRSDLIPGGKTLDSDAIKQYQNIKQNTAAVSGKQQRYSGMFSEKTQSQPIRDEYCFVSTNQKTGERSKERQNLSSSTSSREHLGQSIYKQNSFDNLTRNTDTLSRDRDKYEGDFIL